MTTQSGAWKWVAVAAFVLLLLAMIVWVGADWGADVADKLGATTTVPPAAPPPPAP